MRSFTHALTHTHTRRTCICLLCICSQTNIKKTYRPLWRRCIKISATSVYSSVIEPWNLSNSQAILLSRYRRAHTFAFEYIVCSTECVYICMYRWQAFRQQTLPFNRGLFIQRWGQRFAFVHFFAWARESVWIH